MPGFNGCGFAGCNLSSGYQLCGLQPFEWKKGFSRLSQRKALREQGISLLGFQMDEEAFRTQVDAMTSSSRLCKNQSESLHHVDQQVVP